MKQRIQYCSTSDGVRIAFAAADLPGTLSFRERLGHRVRSTEQNWLIKAALLIGAAIGLALSIVQLAQALG